MTEPASQQINLRVTPLVYRNMQKRAGEKGLSVGGYAKLLFEAAYAARVGGEKDMPVTDAELDQQVRAIFCLAGEFDERAIAKATGFPKSLVGDILKGFEIVAPTLRQNVPEGEATAPPSGPMRHGWPPEIYEKVRQMWAAGASISVIARRIGKTAGALAVWSGKNRDICPKRLPEKVA
jgi:hypothetical protein